MSRHKGNLAEAQVVDYLIAHAFEVIDRNVYSRFGEIDIIALKDGVLHFIEVKSGPSYEQAVYNITASKLQKILKTVNYYLTTKQLVFDYVIDAAIVTGDRIELIENITL